MPLVCNAYTTPGHLSRTSKNSVLPGARVDICYNVWQQTEPSTISPKDRINFVLLHGSQLCKEVWNFQVELLFKRYGSKLDKCITIDALNSGHSALLNQGKIGWYHAWHDLARDSIKVIYDVRERSGIPGPLFAVGHSMGGAEVLCMGFLDPGLFAGLIVMDPVWGSNNLFSMDPAKQYAGNLAYKVMKNAKEEFESLDEYYKFMNNRFVSSQFHPRLREDVNKNLYYERNGKVYLKTNRIMQASAYLGCISMENHSISTFKYIPLPVLVMHGDIDDWNGPRSNEELAETLLNSEEAVIPGGGHLVFQIKPEETIEKMVPWVDKIAAEYDSSDSPVSESQFRDVLQRMQDGVFPKL